MFNALWAQQTLGPNPKTERTMTNFYIKATNSNGTFEWQGSSTGTAGSFTALSALSLDSSVTYDLQFSSDWVADTLAVLMSQSGADYGVVLPDAGATMNGFEPASGTLNFNATTKINYDPKIQVSSSSGSTQISLKWTGREWEYARAGDDYAPLTPKTPQSALSVLADGTIMIKDSSCEVHHHGTALFADGDWNHNSNVHHVLGFSSFDPSTQKALFDMSNYDVEDGSLWQTHIYAPMSGGRASIGVRR